MQGASLQRIVQRNSDTVNRCSRMLKPDMASPLPDYRVSYLLQRADQTSPDTPRGNFM